MGGVITLLAALQAKKSFSFSETLQGSPISEDISCKVFSLRAMQTAQY